MLLNGAGTVALSCILGHFPVKIRVQVCANPNSSDSNTGQILLPRAIFPWIDFSLVPGVARLGRSLLNSVILRCEIIQLNRINYLWLLNDHHGGKNTSWKRRIYQRLEWNWSQQYKFMMIVFVVIFSMINSMPMRLLNRGKE